MALGFQMFTVAEAISKAFRENSDKQSGQLSVMLVNSEGEAIKATPQEENRLGSDCDGFDSAPGRTLTLQNTIESGAPNAVWVEDQLIASADITFSHLSSSSKLTFDNIEIYDADTIRVTYYV